MKRALLALCCALPAAAFALPSFDEVRAAHKPSDSYLSLDVDGTRVTGRWDIALRDLDVALGLDADGDGRITWGELRARHAHARLQLFSSFPRLNTCKRLSPPAEANRRP